MRLGLMWADFSKDNFAVKCNRAIKYYTEKYGMRPTAIQVNPKTAITDIPGIAIVQSRSILPHHFWIGLTED